MFNSLNAHIVTRFHSDLVNSFAKGEITAAEGLDKLISFEAREAIVEIRTHDAVVFSEPLTH